MNHFKKAHHQSVNKFLAVIRSRAEPVSIKQLCEVLDAGSKLSFNGALNTLLERGYIRCEERLTAAGKPELFYREFSSEINEKYSKEDFSACEKRTLEVYAIASNLDYLKLLRVLKNGQKTAIEGRCRQ